ncbi:FAD:protein FMN transferase [Mycoplasmatota bacterium WC44]
MKKIILVITLLTLLISGCNKENNDDLYRYEKTYEEYLNTITFITMYHTENVDTNELAAGIEDILISTHNVFDAHDENSELGSLNSKAHIEPVKVSDNLYEIIKESLYYAEISDGAYDPTIGPLADLWNITSDSWFTGGIIPSETDIQEALEYVDYTKVILDDDDKTVFFEKEGIKLDLGGIAKGHITELIRDYLLDNDINNGIINVGSSSQLTIGTRCVVKEQTTEGVIYEDTGAGWKIGTADPFDLFGLYGPVGVFPLVDRALSTSGSAQQFFELDGKRYHHIFDTETGYPADNNLIVVQIKSDNLVGVDAVSTMIYVMGLEKGMEYVESIDGLDAIFITYDKEIYRSSNFEGYEIINSKYSFKTL